VLLRIDAACQSFEAAWKATREGGTRPRIEDYLADAPEADRAPLLRELLPVELHYRRHEQPSPSEYHERFPEYGPLLKQLLDQLSPVAESTVESVAGAGCNQCSTGPELPQERQSPASATLEEEKLPLVRGYEILGLLGKGGTGVVYKARQIFPPRTVALKMIRAGAHADQQELDRFRTEAEAVARIQHPHIVQIFEVGEHEGLPYFSLEFCAAGSLASKLDGAPLSAREAAELVETLARAMHAAHHKGIIHRDLKPANVLLVPAQPSAEPTVVSGVKGLIPKITDFGLAKKLEEVGQTQSGAM
jgi:hypothetical protein